MICPRIEPSRLRWIVKTRLHTLGVLAAWLATLTLIPSTARAQYLDPGSGSIIAQAVIAGVVAVAAAARLYWVRLSALFVRRRKSDGQH
jgi:hypothetical protein